MDNQLSTGCISRDEHDSLVEDIDKYYELQKKKLSPDKPSAEEAPVTLPQPGQNQFTDQQSVATVGSVNDNQTITEGTHSNEPAAPNILEQVSKAPVNMSDLLSKLVKTGLLPQQQPTESIEPTAVAVPPTNTTQQVDSMDEHLPPAIRMNPALRIPDLHLKIPHLKQ